MAAPNVVDVVLFVSKFSKSSVPCIELIVKNKMPVSIIPLDTKELRILAATAKRIQIKNVPTMVVVYDTGDVQAYMGAPTIINWFNNMQKQSNQPLPSSTSSMPIK